MTIRWHVIVIGVVVVCMWWLDTLQLDRRFSLHIDFKDQNRTINNSDTNTTHGDVLLCQVFQGQNSILLPTKPDLKLIDRLRESLGNDTFDQEFSKCPVTCQVQIIPKCPFWELQTLDEHGNPKTVGGDELYVTYTDEALYQEGIARKGPFYVKPFTAAAWITDLNNGRYQLDFQASPLSQQSHIGKGILAVYFQYTCQLGQMGPPSKAKWIDGGNSAAAHKTQMLDVVPPIRPFETPASNNRPNLYDFDAIVPVGDSLLQQYLGPLRISFGNIDNALNATTLDHWKSTVREGLKNRDLDLERIALVMDSCVWDILEVQTNTTSTTDNQPGWLDHGQSLRALLYYVKTTYPQVTLLWKSCTAVHIHIPFLYASLNQGASQFMKERTKYMSSSRVSELYSIQRDIILQEIEESKSSHPETEQRLYFLDVYPAFFLSADNARDGDGRHYKDTINIRTINWYVNETLVEKIWRESTTHRGDKAHSNGIIEVRCSKNPASLILTLVNSALVATLTGRQLLWDHDTMSTASCLDRTQTETEEKSGVNILRVDAQDDLMTMKSLEEHGYLVETRSAELASHLFSQGSNTLYGMILHRLLQESVETVAHQSHSLVEDKVSTSMTNSYTIVIAPFLDTMDTERLDRCLRRSLVTDRSYRYRFRFSTAEPQHPPSCQILAPSAQWAQAAQSTSSLQEHNCTIRLASIDDGTTGSRDITFLGNYTQLATLQHADERGAVIVSCRNPFSMLFLHLMNFLQYTNARKYGGLPLRNNFFHCCLDDDDVEP